MFYVLARPPPQRRVIAGGRAGTQRKVVPALALWLPGKAAVDGYARRMKDRPDVSALGVERPLSRAVRLSAPGDRLHAT